MSKEVTATPSIAVTFLLDGPDCELNCLISQVPRIGETVCIPHSFGEPSWEYEVTGVRHELMISGESDKIDQLSLYIELTTPTWRQG